MRRTGKISQMMQIDDIALVCSTFDLEEETRKRLHESVSSVVSEMISDGRSYVVKYLGLEKVEKPEIDRGCTTYSYTCYVCLWDWEKAEVDEEIHPMAIPFIYLCNNHEASYFHYGKTDPFASLKLKDMRIFYQYSNFWLRVQ